MTAGVQQRGLIVKFHSFIQHAIVIAASVLLAACGGGATTNPNQGGELTVAPAEGTFYAGVPSTITISGGRTPYSLTSSEPTILPVPATVSSHSIQVVPNNPGVIDAGLPPNSLPIRTINVTVRDADSSGGPQIIKIHVAVNFLLGYGVSFKSNCPAGASGASASACAGGQTQVTLLDTTNGVVSGNRKVRFIAMRGPFHWVFPDGTTGNSIDLITDHTGTVNAIFQVDQGVPSQLAVLRVQDIATGVYVDEIFTISGTVTPTSLTVIPSSMNLTAALKGVCGTGTGDFLVFDGTGKYTATSTDPNLGVSPSFVDSGSGIVGAKFTANASNPSICLAGATIVVVDSNGGRGTFTVTTKEGSGSPPPPGLQVSPNGVTVSCGQTASVTVVGGAGTYSASSTDPNLTVSGSGNTLSIKRNGTLVLPGGNQTTTVNVTDGTTIAQVSVTSPVNCTP